MLEILFHHLRGLNLPNKGVVRLTDLPDVIIAVYRGRKTTNQQHQKYILTSRLYLLKSPIVNHWNVIKGSNMVFNALTSARSRGTLQTLMH